MLQEPTKECLYSLYYKENKSLEEIGKIFNKCRWSIKQLIKKGNPLSKIGKRFNVGYEAIYKIKTGRTWKHVT